MTNELFTKPNQGISFTTPNHTTSTIPSRGSQDSRLKSLKDSRTTPFLPIIIRQRSTSYTTSQFVTIVTYNFGHQSSGYSQSTPQIVKYHQKKAQESKRPTLVIVVCSNPFPSVCVGTWFMSSYQIGTVLLDTCITV